MNPPPQDTGSHAVKLTPPLSDAVRLLKSAARENNPDALYLLADMHFYGNFSHPRNYSEAFRLYHHLASLTGNGTAQHMVGFMYGTGFGGAVTRDQGKALLFHTFAALGGETRSEMTVAFRHYTGVGAPRNCDEAAFYYKKVADKAIHHWRSGPPGGRSLIRNAYRLADDEGGVYGEGASVSSSGPNAVQGGSSADAHAALDDVLEYLDLMSRKGDLKATFSLGRLHYDGSRAMRRNLRKAKAYFMIIARKQWPQDGRVPTANIPGLDKLAARAAGYLGRMFLRGEGMEQSFEKAETWFRRGLEFGDFTSQNGMGLLYLHGYGVPRDVAKAAEFFKESATQDYAPAQVHLGALFLDQGDVQVAIRYFELAARNGHVEAFYYLAEILNQGIGRERSCVTATAYFKIVAETVEYLHSDFETANQAYHNGDTETALIQYTMAAEQGFEAGQANVAYLLDDEKSRLPINPLPSSKKRKSSLLRDQALALVYWTRSAKQSNIDSLVKMGDYYLKGVGADADSEKAATCYQAAAETPQSAQALWNLGWMHENGIGVEQDYHLAKRLYDQALETNQEAYLPVSLSLLKLRLRSFWNTITNGRVNSIQPDPEPQRDWSFREWIHNFLQDDHPPYDDMYEDDDGMDTQQDGLAGTADIFDDFVDDGIVESLLIVALAAVLAFLVYYRQQRQLNHRRAEQQHAPIEGGFTGPAPVAEAQGAVQEQDRGLFPRPEDPEFGQWVAGGVMH
ncbi:MAG: ERAD-associated protein [Piccolia ochrophora]|nr:MAG: ERAD-associated protein [Piccolia ochrophora]